MQLHRHTRRFAAASALAAVLVAGAACGTQTASDVGSPQAPAAAQPAENVNQLPSTVTSHSPTSADAAEHYGAEHGRPGASHPTPDARP